MASGDGGTGSPGDSSGSVPEVSAQAVAAALSRQAAPANVELYGDLHEYGLSLGVDLDAEGEEDFIWLIQEAFNAPLPSNWTEYMDESGRAYYVQEGSSQSTWEHPADGMYRELLDLIRKARSLKPALQEEQRADLVKEHLTQVHETAKEELAGWSGPYASEQGEYYYNERMNVSSWESPIALWETELETRHAVLLRYLLPEHVEVPSSRDTLTGSGQVEESTSRRSTPSMLQALRLQLGNLHREPGGADVPEPSTCRSYHTARSATSSRSGRSKQSIKEHKERRKERKARREAGGSEEDGRLADLPEGPVSPSYGGVGSQDA
eukprot:TRINITY_DN38770_c0_g1_i1.p1 TRINITY_DN38770_c0_g1~~TRINITY_DN38770_c0_g1_i1.p1  ORF type:complete len:323 (+),score=54.55 TRINITY_DN38770_c0_g1_i1:43-1011(+)